MAKKGGHFRSNIRDLPIGAEQKLKAEIGHSFFKPITFVKNTRLADATQRLQHYGAGAITCKPAPHRDALWWSSTSMRPM